MNLKSYKIECFKKHSEYQLRNLLCLLDLIDKFEKGELFALGAKQDEFDNLVNEICKKQPNINDIDEKRINRVFPKRKLFSDREACKNLVYYQVGKQMHKEKTSFSLEDFRKWGDACMAYTFCWGCQLSKEVLSNLIGDLETDKVLHDSRSCEFRKDELETYCKNEFNLNQSDDELISKINMYNDGSYVELPVEVDVLLGYFEKEKHFDLWLKLYDILAYVPLQGGIICYLNTIEDCLSILKEEECNPVQHHKVFAYLMRERCYELLHREADLIERNTMNEYIKDSNNKKLAQEINDQWIEKQPKLTEDVFNWWKKAFNTQEIIIWVGKKRANTYGRDPKYFEKELLLIGDIEGRLKSEDIDDSKWDSLDLRNLLSIANVLADNFSHSKAEHLIDRICDCIYNEKHYKRWGFSEIEFNEMRAVCKCLSLSEMDGLCLMQKYRKITEGYKVNIEDCYQMSASDTMWFSILLLQLEIKWDAQQFKRVVNEMLRLMESNIGTDDDYFLPCCIAELLVCSINDETKEWYEINLIKYIPQVSFVLRVLFANKGEMKDKAKKLLQKRIQEWDLELLTNRNLNAQNKNSLSEYVKSI